MISKHLTAIKGNEEPGNVNAPIIFEPPLDLSDGKVQYGRRCRAALTGVAVMCGQVLTIPLMK